MCPPVGLNGTRHHHPADELDELLLDLCGSAELAEGDLELLQALAAGDSIGAIAGALGCTDRTVRNRRQGLVTKLRELSGVAA